MRNKFILVSIALTLFIRCNKEISERTVLILNPQQLIMRVGAGKQLSFPIQQK